MLDFQYAWMWIVISRLERKSILHTRENRLRTPSGNGRGGHLDFELATRSGHISETYRYQQKLCLLSRHRRFHLA
jgi:hypothetical protein